MGFYFKKSIHFGGVRFNFSKSGIGASAGAKGFRVGTNSRGNYVYMGRSGLYYRAAIGKKKSNYRTATSQASSLRQMKQPVSTQVPQEELHFQDIDSGEVALIIDSSSQDLVNEINAKRKKFLLWPLAVLLVFIPGAGNSLFIIAAIVLLALMDRKRKTTVLIYDIDEDTEREIQSFYNSFDELGKCSGVWHVSSQASVRDRKYHAGANQVVNRAAIRIRYKTPKYLKTNVKVPSIPVGSQTIYFFPDKILIYDKKSVGGLAYNSFSVTRKNQSFIENGIVPRDGTIVDHTWQYVNKSGGPDKRFSNNRKLPILLYTEVLFTSNSGLNELVQFSKQTAGIDLINRLEQYKRSTFLSNDISSTQAPALEVNDSFAKPSGSLPSEKFPSVDDMVPNYMRNTPKENLFLTENWKNDEHFAPIQSLQTNQGSRYASEKIAPNPSARDKQSEPYAIFKKMKQISGHRSEYVSYYSDDADIFYKQALFMKDFTDNYDEIVPLDTYYTTYGKMNDAQLRTYFTWRTKVRQGIIEDTSLSYVFCYIFELLNDVGADSPNDVIEKLVTLWVSFRQFNDKLDNHLCEWIRDYYVVNKAKLSAVFPEYSCRFPVPYHEEDMEVLVKARSCSWDDLCVIEASSSFKITNGQFYKAGNQEIIEKCVCFTIRELAKVFKTSGVDFRNMFFENRREKIYSLFQGAVHPDIAALPITVELDAFETIKHNTSGWQREYGTILQYRAAIGYILKLIEVKMRQHFGYKRNLQVPNISVVENCFLNSEAEKFAWPNRPSLDKLKVWKRKAFALISSDSFEAAIVHAIFDYCKAENIVIQGSEVRIVKPVEIDMSKLKDIEREHMETAAKLITEELSVDTKDDISILTPVSVVPTLEIDGIAGLVCSLPTESNNLLLIILEGGQVPTGSELLIETINEKALEVINDNLIDYAEGVPYIYDDYIDDLKSSLGGQ